MCARYMLRFAAFFIVNVFLWILLFTRYHRLPPLPPSSLSLPLSLPVSPFSCSLLVTHLFIDINNVVNITFKRPTRIVHFTEATEKCHIISLNDGKREMKIKNNIFFPTKSMYHIYADVLVSYTYLNRFRNRLRPSECGYHMRVYVNECLNCYAQLEMNGWHSEARLIIRTIRFKNTWKIFFYYFSNKCQFQCYRIYSYQHHFRGATFCNAIFVSLFFGEDQLLLHFHAWALQFCLIRHSRRASHQTTFL